MAIQRAQLTRTMFGSFFRMLQLLVVSITGNWRLTPSLLSARCCVIDIAVPWKESLAVLELGLWSILSTAATVNTSFLKIWGQTILSSSNWLQTLLPSELLKFLTHGHMKWINQVGGIFQLNPDFLSENATIIQHKLVVVFPYLRYVELLLKCWSTLTYWQSWNILTVRLIMHCYMYCSLAFQVSCLTVIEVTESISELDVKTPQKFWLIVDMSLRIVFAVCIKWIVSEFECAKFKALPTSSFKANMISFPSECANTSGHRAKYPPSVQ